MTRRWSTPDSQARLDAIVCDVLCDLDDDKAPVHYRRVHTKLLEASELRNIQQAVEASDGFEVLSYLRQMKERAVVMEPHDLHFVRN